MDMENLKNLFLSVPSLRIQVYIVTPDHRTNQIKKQFNRITFQKLISETKRKIEIIYY